MLTLALGLKLTAWMALELAVGLAVGLADTGTGSGAGAAPSIPPRAELWAGTGSSALITAAQPADLALNPSACHRLCSSQRGAGGGQGPRASCGVLCHARHSYPAVPQCSVPCSVCCAMLCRAMPRHPLLHRAMLHAVLCQTPASSKRQEGPS